MYIKTNFIKNHRWRFDAVCAQTDPELFHSLSKKKIKEAQDICSNCPVLQECLKSAMKDHDWWYGVRAGMTPEERRDYAENVLGLDTNDQFNGHDTVSSYLGLVRKPLTIEELCANLDDEFVM